MRWRRFKLWQATKLEEAIGKLKTTTSGKMKEILKPYDEIEIENNVAAESSNEVSTPSVPTLTTLTPPAQHMRRIARSMAVSDD